MMYSVVFSDDFLGEVKVFEGSLNECLQFITDDEFDELYIVEPDGFTVYES